MLFYTRSYGKYVQIKNNILGRKVHLVRSQDIIGALYDLYSTIIIVCLPYFVKCHHNSSSSVTLDLLCLLYKFFFSPFETYRIYDRLSLYALQARLYDLPFRRIYHDRNTSNIRLGSNQVQKGNHSMHTIEHTFIHIDI